MPFLHVSEVINGEGSFLFRFVAPVKTGAIWLFGMLCADGS